MCLKRYTEASENLRLFSFIYVFVPWFSFFLFEGSSFRFGNQPTRTWILGSEHVYSYATK